MLGAVTHIRAPLFLQTFCPQSVSLSGYHAFLCQDSHETLFGGEQKTARDFSALADDSSVLEGRACVVITKMSFLQLFTEVQRITAADFG